MRMEKGKKIGNTRKESKKTLKTKGNMKNPKNGELGGSLRGENGSEMLGNGANMSSQVVASQRYQPLVDRKSSQ